MKTKLTTFIIFAFSFIAFQSGAQTPTYTLTSNNVVVTPTYLEFDMYLKNSNAAVPFRYAGGQYVLDFDNSILTTGLTWVATSFSGSVTSNLLAGCKPTTPVVSFNSTTSMWYIRMAINSYDASVFDTIPATGNGVLAGKVRITATAGFNFDITKTKAVFWRNTGLVSTKIAAWDPGVAATTTAFITDITQHFSINPAGAVPTAPTVGNISHPTCTIATGSVALSGIPLGNWTITATPGGMTQIGSAISTTFTGLTGGSSYTFHVTNAGGTSPESTPAVINARPIIPTKPILGTVVQPTCTVNTGSVPLSGLPTGNWTITPDSVSGTAVGSVSGTGLSTNFSMVAGTHYIAVINSAGCMSPATAAVTIGQSPAPNVNVSVSGIELTAAMNSPASNKWVTCPAYSNAPVSASPGSTTSRLYIPTVNGDYAVIIDNGTCKDTSLCVTVNSVGIDESLSIENKISISPNPNNGVFLIQSKSEGVYTIINNLGQTIQVVNLNSKNNFVQTIDNLNIGVYYIVGESNKQITRQKIMVTK